MEKKTRKEVIIREVKGYINSELQRNQSVAGYNSTVVNALGYAESGYLKELRLTGGYNGASLKADELLVERIEELYEDFVIGAEDEVVKDPENKKEVLWNLDYILKFMYGVEVEKFRTLFPVEDRLPSLENAYLYHIKDLEYRTPTYIYTDFLQDRDILKFADRMEEVYRKSKDDTLLRTKPYFRLMYFLEGDPRDKTVKDARGVDWDKINPLIFNYILTSKELKGDIRTTHNSNKFYADLDYYNQVLDYFHKDKSEYESAYLGTLIYNNNIYPKRDITKALQMTIQTILRDPVLAHEEGYNPESVLDRVLTDLSRTGASVIKVKGVTFIVGRTLNILEEVRGKLVVREVIAHSKVKPSLIRSYTEKQRVNV